MTAVVERPTPAYAGRTLWTLAGVDAVRYARHPLFLVGAALLAAVTLIADDLTAGDNYGLSVPAFFLGVLGVFVANQLARSMAGSADAVEATPTDGVVRAAALCLACLVPAALALVWVGWVFLTAPVSAELGGGDLPPSQRTAVILSAVVYAAGGPLVGLMVGRWIRFRAAGLLAAVALVAWTLLGTITFTMAASRLSSLVHVSAPFTFWVVSESADDPLYVVGGSPWWYLAYITLLCCLAACAAMLRGAHGKQRSRLLGALAGLAVLAAAALALAAAPDPAWVML